MTQSQSHPNSQFQIHKYQTVDPVQQHSHLREDMTVAEIATEMSKWQLIPGRKDSLIIGDGKALEEFLNTVSERNCLGFEKSVHLYKIRLNERIHL